MNMVLLLVGILDMLLAVVFASLHDYRMTAFMVVCSCILFLCLDLSEGE